MRGTLAGNLVDGIKFDGPFPPHLRCVWCSINKSIRQPHNGDPTPHLPTGKLERVDIDLSGKLSVTSVRGNNYFMLIRDIGTRKPWVIFLKNKSETFREFVAWKTRVEKQSGKVVKKVHTDQGSEFLNGRWNDHFRREGIVRGISNRYTAEENPYAERGMRTTKESARTSLNASGLPPKYWDFAVEYAVWCEERLSSTAGHAGKTSFEAFTDTRPSVADARAFGTTCFPHIPGQVRRKGDMSAPRGVEGRVIGIATTCIGWKVVWNGGKIEDCSNVEFWDPPNLDNDGVDRFPTEEDDDLAGIPIHANAFAPLVENELQPAVAPAVAPAVVPVPHVHVQQAPLPLPNPAPRRSERNTPPPPPAQTPALPIPIADL
ncbi:putative transposase, partial [Phenoliferia sp. Uapishka_3]